MVAFVASKKSDFNLAIESDEDELFSVGIIAPILNQQVLLHVKRINAVAVVAATISVFLLSLLSYLPAVRSYSYMWVPCRHSCRRFLLCLSKVLMGRRSDFALP